MRKQIHILIKGRVQGVAFRAYAQQRARALRLQGYVRNLPDGDVEIVAEGERPLLEQLLNWARRGPSGALVTDVQVEFSDAGDTFSDFTIRP